MSFTKPVLEAQIGGCAREWSLPKSHVFYWSMYALSITVGSVGAWGIGTTGVFAGEAEYALYLGAVGDILGTLTIYVVAIMVNNTSMYDPMWSIFPPVVSIYWALAAASDNNNVPVLRTVLVMVSIWVWSVRLTSNFIRDWVGLHHEDFRYINLHVIIGSRLGHVGYWIVGSLLSLMLFPTVLVFFGCVPFYYALYTGLEDGANDVNALDFVATALAVSGATLQFVADEQMRNFRRSEHDPEEFMQSGLWRYSRHPNYFGELLFWLALYIHALAVNLDLWWTVIGFILLLLLIVATSIPMMEARLIMKRPGYVEYVKTTSRIIPLPRFKGSETSEVA